MCVYSECVCVRVARVVVCLMVCLFQCVFQCLCMLHVGLVCVCVCVCWLRMFGIVCVTAV